MKIALYAGLCLLLTACGSGGGDEKNSNSTSSINQSASSLSKASESSLSGMNSSSLMSTSSLVSSSSSSSVSSSSRNSSVTSSRSSSSVSSVSSRSSSRSSATSSANNSSTFSVFDRAIIRGASFFGVAEEFNRYYTDPDWTPSRTVYVSANGSGNGMSASTPAAPQTAINNAQPGDLIQFAAGEYNACYNIDQSGSYDDPIVLKGTRDAQGNLATLINCCSSGRSSCINIELANHIALDSFELNGGEYGVRIVGEYATSGHVKGNAVLNSYGHDNSRDPFFTGGSDWFVIQGNKGERAGTDDGHGIYLSNGSDFNIVRYNDLNDNSNSDFQINADPLSTCADEGIDFADDRCDGDAKNGQGDGVSEYILVENNYFHNGRRQGPNFTSVRNSIVRNNIIAFYERHGVSFWQETDNPNLGASNNIVHHNLLIGINGSELFQFHRHANNNNVKNNVIIGINLSGSNATVNSSTVVLATSDTSTNNTFVGNMYIGGRLVLMNDDTDHTGDASPGSDEFTIDEFDSDWFVDFPFDKLGSWDSFKPTSSAPWINKGLFDSESPDDFGGAERNLTPELGPWESPAD